MEVTGKINQKDYLRKYLSSGEGGKKKKKQKKKLKVGPKTLKIIDDDADLKNMRPIEHGEFKIFNASNEDAPQIVGVIDERGPVDFSDKRRWKIIADDGEGNVTVSENSPQCRGMDENSGNWTQVSQSKRKEKSKKLNVSKSLNSEDLSPLRNLDLETVSKSKSQRHKDSKQSSGDVSPPRKSKNNYDDDLSPPRPSMQTKRNRKTLESSEDENYLRSSGKSKSKDQKLRMQKKGRKSSLESNSDFYSGSSDSEAEKSTTKKSRRETNKRLKGENGKRADAGDSDLSPPRDLKKRHVVEKSRSRRDSHSDLNVPSRSKYNQRSDRCARNSSTSPARTSRKPRGSDSDLSPPRRSNDNKKSLTEDQNLSRIPVKTSRTRRGSDSDTRSPRRSNKEPLGDARHNLRSWRRENFRNDREIRRGRDDSDSASGPSEKYRKRSCSLQRVSRWSDERERKSRCPEIETRGGDTRMKKTLDGKTAGLQDARALRIETEAHKRREADLFTKMSKEMSGAGQAPILRDRKTGKRRDLAIEASERREKEKQQEEIDEKYAKWGKGLKQVEDQADKRESDLHEMSKPLARYADDADLDKQLREVMHDGDPMLEYIKQKQIKTGKRQPDQPSYQGSYMPNRFGIKPGHRWDGVDRSNGYEKKWFDARNARIAVQEEAYKWSTADM